MRIAALTLGAVLAVGLVSRPAALEERGGDERFGPYDVVEGWPQPLRFAKPGYIWGSTGGIFAETPNRVFIANRGEIKLPEKLPRGFTGFFGSLGTQATSQVPEFRNCIVAVDSMGKAVESWTQWDHLFEDGRGPHQVLISPYDPEHHVWVVDDMRHQIFKFTNDGKKLVMTLGESGIFGDNEDTKHFRRPTDIAWLPDGSFFISDGYGNKRFLKFDKDGHFIKKWGTPGTGPVQFNTPHSVATDKKGRLYVVDRGNNRVQVFDSNGNLLDIWPDITNPYTIRISEDQYAWVFSGNLDKILKYDLNGKLLYAWGTHGTAPGFFWAVHEFSADSDNNLYTAEVFGGRPQKFTPKPGADPAKVFHAQKLMPMKASSN